MGSTFTTIEVPGWGGLNDKEAYIQFVPGQVVEVVTSIASKTYTGDTAVLNSIIAMPHISNKPLKETLLGEQYRYKPLFRGLVDVPVKGDPVLLCTIGGVNYYLGPLNTQGQPNFNLDHLKKVDASVTSGGTHPKSRAGVSLNFPFMKQRRLQKYYNTKLDYPYEGETPAGQLDIQGDLVLEGRHGNSIRIGSRYVNPYIIISNARPTLAAVENSNDGSVFGMFHRGTLSQHFANDGEVNPDTDEIERSQFTLADAKIEDPLRTIQGTFSTGIGRGILDAEESYEASEDIYEYKDNQIFLSSDRIVFNARKDSIFMSAFQYLHFGAGNTITFSTSNNFHISAETRTVIDSPIIKLGTDIDEDTEPLVLGDQLVDFLKKLMLAIKKINTNITAQVFMTGAGPTFPGPTNSTAFEEVNTIDIQDLEDKIEEILSITNRTT
jgi:hypothetical protein